MTDTKKKKTRKVSTKPGKTRKVSTKPRKDRKVSTKTRKDRKVSAKPRKSIERIRLMYGKGVLGKDHNDVSIPPNQYVVYDEFAFYKIVPIKIIIDGVIYKHKEDIGTGANGKVVEYTNSSGTSVVIKVGEINDDMAVIRNLEKNKKCEKGVVPYQLVNRDLYLMDQMDGDLIHFAENILDKINNVSAKYQIIFDILQQLAIILKCLIESNGIYYTDLKLGNVLYKIINEKLVIVLGDIGGGLGTVSTYPPFERRKDRGIIESKATEKDITWMMGIILLSLGGRYDVMRKLGYDNIVGLKTDDELIGLIQGEINHFHKNIKDEEVRTKIIALLKGCFDTRPSMRPTLDAIISLTSPIKSSSKKSPSKKSPSKKSPSKKSPSKKSPSKKSPSKKSPSPSKKSPSKKSVSHKTRNKNSNTTSPLKPTQMEYSSQIV